MIDLGMHGLDHSQVLALLCSEAGLAGTRYRIEVLREGIPVGTLDYLDCSLEMDAGAQVKHCGRITARKQQDWDLRTHRLRPVMSLDYGGRPFEFPFPPLCAVTVGERVENGEVFQSIEAYDEAVTIQENSVGELLFFPRGTLYTAAVERLLYERGVRLVDIEPSGLAMGEDREDWEESDSILAVANALLEEIGYQTLAADRDGVLAAGRRRENRELPDIWYRAGSRSVLRADKTVETDGYRRPNRFVGVVFTAGMEEPWRYEWVNTDPASPSSVPNAGYVRTQVLRYDNVADYATLRDKVHRHAEEVAASYEYAGLYTAILPHHGVGELVGVEALGLEGIWEETGWRIDRFGPGGWMQHTLRRAVFP